MTKPKNCLSCSLWSVCSDKKKGFDHVCPKYRHLTTKEILGFEKRASLKKSVETVDFNPKVNSSIERDILDILNSNQIVAPDLHVDDSDIKQAPNIGRWIRGKNYLNTVPFARQYYMALELYQDYCPKCSDTKWFQRKVEVDTPLDEFDNRMQLLRYGKCPKCKGRKSEFIADGTLNDHFELVAICGQRSGKSVFSSLANSYNLHCLLKLQNPTQVYGLFSNQDLHCTFLALSFQHARDTIWQPFQSLMEDAPWFRQYHQMLDHYGEKYGEELYSLKDIYVKYSHRSMHLYPSGPNMKILRGKARPLAGIDELGLFNFDAGSEDQVKMGGEGIHRSLKNSMTGVIAKHEKLRKQGYDNLVPPMMLNISSPIDINDNICRLEREHKDSTTVMTIHLPTWEMNPDLPRDSAVLREEFKRNEALATRDFGAVPPMSGSPYIADIEDLDKIVSKHKNCALVRSKKGFSKTGKRMTSARYDNVWMDAQVPKVMTLDAGSVNNSFSICIAHKERRQDGSLITVYDLMTEVIARKKAPISFTSVANQVIMPLISTMNVQLVASDRWQSLKIMSDIEEMKRVPTIHHTLHWDDFDDFRNNIYEGEIETPRTEMPLKRIGESGEQDWRLFFKDAPVSHFMMQLLTVKDTGKSVDKGSGRTDDIFRAAVLANTVLHEPKYADMFIGNLRNGPRGLISVATRSNVNPSNNSAGSGNSRVVAVASRGSAVASASRVFTNSGAASNGQAR